MANHLIRKMVTQTVNGPITRKTVSPTTTAIYRRSLCIGIVVKLIDTDCDKFPYQAFVYTSRDGTTKLVASSFNGSTGARFCHNQVVKHECIGRNV